MNQFAVLASAKAGRDLRAFSDLHAWSVDCPAEFWQLTAEFCGIIWQEKPAQVLRPPASGRGMRGFHWFPGAKLNYAENLLAGEDRPAAVISLCEGAYQRSLSLGALRREVAMVAAALAAHGVGPGDCVGAVIANIPEALIAMLATAALGAVWSSCSPDFGAAAILDRLLQIQPKVVFFTAGYVYNGKRFDLVAQSRHVAEALPSLRRGVLVQHLGQDLSPAGPSLVDTLGRSSNLSTWDDFLATGRPSASLQFAAREFSDPLFMMFSSGTTGVPKAIVHSVGGTLLQHKKELLLHSEIGPGRRLLFYTTCGWMMWNWSMSALATGADLVLFEGSVSAPDLGVLWRSVQAKKVDVLGTSPKFIAACMQHDIHPAALLGAHSLRTVLTTGSPLLPEHFAWLYRELPHASDLHVASISGGTDIISCFMLGTPTLPVKAGEIQYAGLGMHVDAWDEQGQSVRGVKAELVCLSPFPAMPLGFLHDPKGERYKAAYFDYYPPTMQYAEVWRHGDYIEMKEDGGIVVYGRSDATLNPGGVRIGTAELYRQVESLGEVADCIAAAKREHGDEEIYLFVKLRPGLLLDALLEAKIKSTLRQALTPRHVPKVLLQVQDIPYTRSGKKVELAVSKVLSGEEVPNLTALANPECLVEYRTLAAVFASVK